MCASGFYRLEAECHECPNTAALLILGYAAGLVCIVALLVTARRMGFNVSALGIGVDFLQVVSMFTAFGFKWPAALTALFKIASISSFNEQLLAPECSISSWGFQVKYVSPPNVFVLHLRFEVLSTPGPFLVASMIASLA
jgi:hypothetical protein